MKFITPKDLKLELENKRVTILDIRESYEFDICNIGGVNIPMEEVIMRVSEIPKTNEIVVMCRTGARAEAMANLLDTDFNVQNVSVLEGGISKWIEIIDNSLEQY